MSKYYYLIAGLPNIALDDSKLAYSVGDFREEVEPMLSAGDKKLVDLFYLKYDNANAVAFVEGSDNLADVSVSLKTERRSSVTGPVRLRSNCSRLMEL